MNLLKELTDPRFTAAALASAAQSGTLHTMKNQDISELEELLLDKRGHYTKAVPAADLQKFPHDQRQLFCVRHGVYQFITTELVDALSRLSVGKTIECGSGNGLLAREMGIPGTDSFMQERPEVRAHYERSGQGIVRYGRDVVKVDAEKAKKRYKPETIIGCWLTGRSGKSGNPLNAFGPRLDRLAKKTKAFILVGNQHVHQDCILFNEDCWEIEAPWIISRASRPEQNRIWVWQDTVPAHLPDAIITHRSKG